ncbi:MAG: GAF domain-containing protein, partial [Candidatus Latescibacteria bacterium]|nr:GAF domain-containing protein [Candidatus Latescibacterota bacterium]
AGGTTGNPIQAPSVPMVIDGEPNMANVSAYVAITGQRVNIPDVYDSEGHDFSKVRAFDENFGYKTTSMLVSPMRNHENEMIGVLQLINATDLDSSEVIDFSADFEELTHSLASQAAVAITNTQLTKGLQDLFESIIQMVATAIDQMSPYTGGHIQRVAGLSLALAQAINETKEGPLADEHLSPADITELYMAGWLHDVGKITTPVYVVDKARKLETIYDRIEAVKIRFGLIRRQIEIDALRSTMKVYADHEMDNNDKKMEIQRTRVEMQEALTEVDDELAFVVDLNTGGEFLDDEKLERLNTIAAKTYDNDGEPVPYLTEDEAANLGIRKGTLTGDER